ncbi:MAG: hypothetical protein KJS83_02230 [Xanthomonadaceae bacterium]|nr:hypothetical protein [Xanthomonadaceae bacterium]MBU6478101.1 hypothetical protein [Xanthomonadaceae bacterium]MDE2054392.1 hypothetical protein [Xanthomonadaceae bacterium]MDE2224536.1 hypothetical protein [Xanthomonadaceae bacterium]
MPVARNLVLAALLAGAPLVYAGSAHAAGGEISCKMHFEIHGWSAFYKTASGSGDVSCSNGQHMRVQLRSKGGGLTFGKSSIDGVGKFSGIFKIDEILGTYAVGEAHAGAARSARGTVMTKGNVSLALSGTGKGWNLGVDFGKFTISR